MALFSTNTFTLYIGVRLSATPLPCLHVCQRLGKVKRSHRIDKEKFYRLLDESVVDDTHPFNEKVREWENFYNYRRPHAAFNGQTPYERFREKVWPLCENDLFQSYNKLIFHRFRIKISVGSSTKKVIDLREECHEPETDDALYAGRKAEV